jgi:tetratricopeptide (TPR) repeat protein
MINSLNTKRNPKFLAMSKMFVSLCFLLTCSLAFSQKQVRKELNKGNKEYKQEKYTDAEVAYRKALELNAHSTDAAYNLGNSLYKQQKFPDAAKQYEIAAEETDKTKIASAWHNIGNVFLSQAVAKPEGDAVQAQPQGNQQGLQQSIEAYKKSLRINPNDDETRYNLALAQKLLDDQQNQDQSKDDKDQKKDEQQEQKKDQQQEQKKNEQQQQQQQQQMQKENAEQILEAMMQNERETQEKVKEEQARQQKQRKTGKNW